MSRPMNITVKCAVCDLQSEQTVLLSTNTFGPPDLDLRPAPMKRQTMCWWVQECPHCGYVAESLDDTSNATKEWLSSDEFASCNGRDFPSKLAKRFYKQYCICSADNKTRDAFYAILHAAWCCDDALDFENATFCRKLALAKLEKITIFPGLNENLFAVKADLLRRAGEFDAVISEFTNKTLSTELLNQIIAFQIKKATEKDTGRYTVDKAVPQEV